MIVKIIECELGGEDNDHVGMEGELVHVGNGIYEVAISEDEICRAKKIFPPTEEK